MGRDSSGTDLHIGLPNGDVYSVYSDDGGRTWRRGNAGRPVEEGPDPSVDATTYIDKPWIAANQNPRGHVYGAWVLFTDSAPRFTPR